MNPYIVIYGSSVIGSKDDLVAKRLEKFGAHWKIQPGVWLICTKMHSELIVEKLNVLSTHEGTVFVSRLCRDSHWVGFQASMNQWLRKRLW